MNKDEIRIDMKQFDEAIKNLKEWVEGTKELKPATCTECGCTFVDARTMCVACLMKLGKEEKPEWEDRLDKLPPSPLNGYVYKDFIRQEFMELALDIKRELLPERYYPDVKPHTRNQMWIDNAILGALRKRGVK